MEVRRAAYDDWYVEADESAVLVDGHVLVLSAMATAVLELVGEGWTALESVVDELVAVFGAPPAGTAHEATATVITELAGSGVLETRPR